MIVNYFKKVLFLFNRSKFYEGSTSMTNNMYDMPGINFKSDFEMFT